MMELTHAQIETLIDGGWREVFSLEWQLVNNDLTIILYAFRKPVGGRIIMICRPEKLLGSVKIYIRRTTDIEKS